MSVKNYGIKNLREGKRFCESINHHQFWRRFEMSALPGYISFLCAWHPRCGNGSLFTNMCIDSRFGRRVVQILRGQPIVFRMFTDREIFHIARNPRVDIIWTLQTVFYNNFYRNHLEVDTELNNFDECFLPRRKKPQFSRTKSVSQAHLPPEVDVWFKQRMHPLDTHRVFDVCVTEPLLQFPRVDLR